MTHTSPARTRPPWFRAIQRFLDVVAGLFQTVAEALLAIMLVINFANIVTRNAGLPSLLWVSPWTGVLVVWAVFLAFYVMYRHHLDIALTIVTQRFGRSGIRLSRLLTALAGLLVVGILLAEAPQILTRQRGNMEMVGLTRYWLSVPLLASALMLALHFLADLVGVLAGWVGDDPAGDERAAAW